MLSNDRIFLHPFNPSIMEEGREERSEERRKEDRCARDIVSFLLNKQARRVLWQTAEHFLRLFNEIFAARSCNFAPIPTPFFPPKPDRKSFVRSVIRNKSSSNPPLLPSRNKRSQRAFENTQRKGGREREKGRMENCRRSKETCVQKLFVG